MNRKKEIDLRGYLESKTLSNRTERVAGKRLKKGICRFVLWVTVWMVPFIELGY